MTPRVWSCTTDGGDTVTLTVDVYGVAVSTRGIAGDRHGEALSFDDWDDAWRSWVEGCFPDDAAAIAEAVEVARAQHGDDDDRIP